MAIFDPPFLGCPTCNPDPQRRSGYRTSAHTLIEEGLFRGYGCGHEFSLYQALRRECEGGVFGIINAFSHWQWGEEQSITVGRIHNFSLPIPEDIQPFAAFLTPATPDGGSSIPFFPKILVLGPTELAVTTSAVASTPAENLGGEMNLMIGVYGCRNKDASGWQSLLYESLTDFSEQRYALAIFKLATSAELLCDRVFELYMTGKGIPDHLTERISGRNWDARIGRVFEISEGYLSDDEVADLKDANGPFKSAVRERRNAYAHDAPEPLEHQEAANAFAAAFPLFWHLDHVKDRVSD